MTAFPSREERRRRLERVRSLRAELRQLCEDLTVFRDSVRALRAAGAPLQVVATFARVEHAPLELEYRRLVAACQASSDRHTFESPLNFLHSAPAQSTPDPALIDLEDYRVAAG